MKQEPPFTVHMEPVEGCTLACSFCGLQSVRNNGANADLGIHGVRSTPYRYMSVLLCDRVCQQIKALGWNPRLEFTGRGEPTMNPDLADIIAVARTWLPKASITLTTNGSGILKREKLDDLFSVGLNTLAFDDYKHSPWRDKANATIKEFAEERKIPLYRYPLDNEGNPHQRFFKQRITIIHDISDNTHGTHVLTNQAGNSFKAISQPLEKRCAKPFREFSIRWDGNVAICCDDWRGQYKVANAFHTGLEEIWNHPRWQAARKFLFQGDRASLQPCNVCNVKTFRNGLLPDKMGQFPLDPPEDDDYLLVSQALEGDQYSPKL